MTYCVTRTSVRGACLIIFISHALVVSQKMDETETVETRINMDPFYSSSVHSLQDNLIYSLESAFQQKFPAYHSKHFPQPFHSGDFSFQLMKDEGISENSNNLNHLDILLPTGNEMKELQDIANKNFIVQMCLQLKHFKPIMHTQRKHCYDFLYQYNSSRRNGKNIRRNKHFKLYESVRFSKRKLLSSSQKNKQNYKQKVSNFSVKRKRKNGSGTANRRKKSETNVKPSTRVIPVNTSANISNSSKVNLEQLALQELEEYEEFVALMKQTFSKDPLRAMLSVSFLLIVIMLAVKCCGMKPTKQHQEKFLDIHEDIHYVNIHDILKHKRPYLPKYLLTWERRLRRKFKKRQRIRKEREQELAPDPVSDNSEEESLIYSGAFDF